MKDWEDEDFYDETEESFASRAIASVRSRVASMLHQASLAVDIKKDPAKGVTFKGETIIGITLEILTSGKVS